MDQIFFTNRKYHNKTDLFPKNQCKITIFTYVHSEWQRVDAGKMMKKLSFHPDDQEGKNTSLHGKSKIQKYKLPSKIFLTQIYVLGNAKFDPREYSSVFPHQIFFSMILKDPSFQSLEPLQAY